jgi:hypothetical protein
MVGAGKTEYAMNAARLSGHARRLVCGRSAVETQLKRCRADLRACGRRKSAEYDQEALGGDRIGDDDPDQGSPQPL